MQTPLQLKAVKLVWNDSQSGEWPSSNSETLRWVDTGHGDGVMLFESDTLNAIIAENRRLRDRVDALEWQLEVEGIPWTDLYSEEESPRWRMDLHRRVRNALGSRIAVRCYVRLGHEHEAIRAAARAAVEVA